MKTQTTIILSAIALSICTPKANAVLLVNLHETKSTISGTWQWNYDYSDPMFLYLFANDWAYLTFGIEYDSLRIDAITYNDTDFGGRARWYVDADDYGFLETQVDYDPSGLVNIDGDFAEKSWSGTFSIRKIGSAVPEGGSSLGMLGLGIAALGATYRRVRA